MAIRIETQEIATKISSSPKTGWGGTMYGYFVKQSDGRPGWALSGELFITNKEQATALIELVENIREQLDR